jgi:hypothetical protein
MEDKANKDPKALESHGAEGQLQPDARYEDPEQKHELASKMTR